MAPRAGTRRRSTREAVVAYVMLAPAMMAFAVFAFWPFYRLIFFSLHKQRADESLVSRPNQLLDTLTGKDFLSGARTSGLLVLYTVPLGIILGVLMAVAVHRKLKGIRIFRTVFSSTVASSVAVSSVVFLTLVNPQIGFFKHVSWLDLTADGSGLYRPALIGVSLSVVWQNLGLTFIIVLAGLQAIPDEVNEAATLDGFGPIRRFFKITLPLLSPTLLFVVVVLTIRALQVYAPVKVLTEGAHQTSTLLYQITNQPQGDYGIGASMAIGLFVISVVVAAAQYGILNRRVHYGN